MATNQSEVTQLMAQITAEYEAGQAALHDTALGTARHDFITTRMERMEMAHQALVVQVGEVAAMQLVVEAIEGKKPS